jgi:putative membrane protein
MDKYAKTFLLAGVLVGAAAAQAQTAAPPGGTGDPTAASSPHQRESTAADTGTREASPTASPEATAASTPHQREASEMKPTAAQLKMASQDGAIPGTFVKKAAIDGMTEVKLGKIAASKAQDPKVKQFAEKMVKDHSKANEELESIAKQKGIKVPDELDAEHQSMLQSLNAKSGKAFDDAYSEHMQADHAKAVALFQGAINGSDPDLAAFAKKTLPTLEQHKQMAKRLTTSRQADASDSEKSYE